MSDKYRKYISRKPRKRTHSTDQTPRFFEEFSTELKIDSASSRETIHKHDRKTDPNSCKEKHFPPSFKQIAEY